MYNIWQTIWKYTGRMANTLFAAKLDRRGDYFVGYACARTMHTVLPFPIKSYLSTYGEFLRAKAATTFSSS